MMQSNPLQSVAVDAPEVSSVLIDTSLYSPGTDIDWSTMALEIARLPPGPVYARVILKPSAGWIDRNPSQLALGMAPYGGAVPLPHPSIFSEMWREEAHRLVTRLGKNLLAQSWFGQVASVCLEPVSYTAGSAESEPLSYWGDYCNYAEEAFNAWMWDGNMDVPECATLIPSAEWRALSSGEYLPDAPVASLCGQFHKFISESVTHWQSEIINALSESLQHKCAVGIGCRGWVGGRQNTCQLWGEPMLETMSGSSTRFRCVIPLDSKGWLPVEGLAARGVTVVGRPAESAPQVAFLMHEPSAYWTGYTARYPEQLMQMRTMLRELTVSIWDGFVSDIKQLPGSVRFVIVAQAGALSPSEISEMQIALRKSQRTVLFIGAVGLVDSDHGNWMVDRLLATIGISISLQLTKATSRCQWVDKVLFGEGEIMPRLVSRLASTITFEDGENANGQRWLPSGKLNWCACVPLHIPLWRDWLAEAQVSVADPDSAEV